MNYDRKPFLRNLPGQKVTDKLCVLVVDGDVKGSWTGRCHRVDDVRRRVRFRRKLNQHAHHSGVTLKSIHKTSEIFFSCDFGLDSASFHSSPWNCILLAKKSITVPVAEKNPYIWRLFCLLHILVGSIDGV